MQRLLIIGAGAIGGCIGGLLCNANKAVVLIARGEHGRMINREGLSVKFPDRIVHCHPECHPNLDAIQWCDSDVVLIATKLNDTQAVMNSLREFAGINVPIVCASNGIQGEKWAAQQFENVVSMMIWMPSVHLHPGDVRVYGQDCPGVLDVGPVCGSRAADISEELSQWLCEAGFDSVHRPDIARWKNSKWITNLGNAAQALVTDDWKSVAKAAQAEGEKVLDAVGMDRVSTDELLARAAHIKLKSIDGEQRPGGSTWQSLQRGKPLETQWIEQAMAELADAHNVAAPVCHAITQAAQNCRRVTAAEILN